MRLYQQLLMGSCLVNKPKLSQNMSSIFTFKINKMCPFFIKKCEILFFIFEYSYSQI